ncbi:MAG: Gldg family protein [Chitinophagaceae bacterium]|nr:Gldg family protein [Chitinophagaceae bacterium]
MFTVFKIAKTELRKIFFSPVAWLILVIFTFQVAIVFTGLYDEWLRRKSLGWNLYSATLGTFGGYQGLFTIVQSYLYLYIPLLTMGIMSRELGTGSIKLLYSSPLTNRQIIWGKYLALVVFCMVLILVLAIFGGFAAVTIDHADVPVIFSGLLGLLLLICAYAAIGLFMSSLTSYTVVAAMGTLGVLALLKYVKDLGQDTAILRDITYWMAISGRADNFISGLITSEDFLYFIIVIGMFLGLTILRLNAGRVKTPLMVSIGKYVAVVVLAMVLGYFSAKPALMTYLDVTRNKTNTLTKASQEVMSKFEGKGLKITTYTNMLDRLYHLALPNSYKYDVSRFDQFLRFKPDIKLDYVYYYHKAENPNLDKQYPDLTDEQRVDTLRKLQNWKFNIQPYSDISKDVDLGPENYRFVRLLENSDGKKTFLRVFDDMMLFPSEAEISAAFKRMVMELPVAGFLSGNGERSSTNSFDRGYKMFAQEKTFRYAMINQGFDFQDVTLDKPVPDNIKILVVSEIRKKLSDTAAQYLRDYIARGGNLLVAGEAGRNEFMDVITEPLGVRFMNGTLVKPSKDFQANLLAMKPTGDGIKFSYYLETMAKRKNLLAMPTGCGIEMVADKGFKATTLFTTDSTGSWNELETTNFVDDSAVFNPAIEKMQPVPTVVALSRNVNGKEQKIIVTGDADWLSNGELGLRRKELPAGNFYLINAAFSWMSDGEVPVDMRRDPPLDRSVTISTGGWSVASFLLKWVLPCLLIACGVLISIRRRGR